MLYPLDAAIKERMKSICQDHGFVSKGRVFFRIHADNVLQVIKFEYERTFSHYSLDIGLMSLYSEAEDSVFTARSALPRYSICCLDNCATAVTINEENGILSFSVRSPADQLCLLEKSGFKWLDNITTQHQLLSAIDSLETISYKSTVWNNRMKLAPFLAIQDYYSADLVIASILNQHLGPDSFSSPPWTEEDFLHYSTRYPTENEDLLYLHMLITNERYDSINMYLEDQYRKNITRLCFLKK